MATTNASLLKRKANAVNLKTVQVGDRVKFGKTLGTVLSVSSWNRIHGYGEIMWDGDNEPTESTMGNWTKLQKA